MDRNTASGPGRLNHVQLRTLRLLVSIVREGSLLRAARRQHIHSSALSRRLSALEFAIGIRIFERRPSGMKTTPEGAVLMARLAAILDELDEALARPRNQQLPLFRSLPDAEISQKPGRSP